MLSAMESAGQGYLQENAVASAALWCLPCHEFYETLRPATVHSQGFLNLARALSDILKKVRDISCPLILSSQLGHIMNNAQRLFDVPGLGCGGRETRGHTRSVARFQSL